MYLVTKDGTEIKKNSLMEHFSIGHQHIAWYTWVGILALVILIVVLIVIMLKKKRR